MSDRRGAASGSEPEATPGTAGTPNDTTISPTEKMRRAKLALSHAAVLALANDPRAAQFAEVALRLIADARAELAALAEGGK